MDVEKKTTELWRECALCFNDLPESATVVLNTLSQGCDCNIVVCYRCILLQLAAPADGTAGNVGFRCPTCRFSYCYVLNVDKALTKMKNNPFWAAVPELRNTRVSTLFTSPTTPSSTASSVHHGFDQCPDNSGPSTSRPLESFFYNEFDALESPLGADVPMRYYTLFVQMMFFNDRINNGCLVSQQAIENMLPPEHFFNDETTQMERKRAFDAFDAYVSKEETYRDMLAAAPDKFSRANISMMVTSAQTMEFESPWTNATGDSLTFDNELQRMVIRNAFEKAIRDESPGAAMRAFISHMPYCVYTFFAMVALSVPRNQFTLRTVLGFAMRTDAFRADQLKYLSEFTARYPRIYIPVQELWIEAFLRNHTEFNIEMQLFKLNGSIIAESNLTPAQCTLDAYFQYYEDHPEHAQLVCGTRVFHKNVTMATQHARFMAQFPMLSDCWYTAEQRVVLESHIDNISAHVVDGHRHPAIHFKRQMNEIAADEVFSGLVPHLRMPVIRAIVTAIAKEHRCVL